MKKLVFLLLLLVGSHEMMQASKQKTCTVAPTQTIDIEENLSNICDDINLWQKLFSDFIQTYSQLKGNKTQNNSTSGELFEKIWQLCSDKNNQIQTKKLIDAKNILYMYTEDQIEKLEILFKTVSANHWNKEIGKDRYTKNNLFSNNKFKTTSFRKFVLFAKDEKKIKQDNLLIEKMENGLTTIQSRQNDIIILNNYDNNEDNDNDYISDEDIERDEIFEFDDIMKKKKEQSFQEKIETIFIQIFNAAKHKNIQLPTENNTNSTPTIQPVNTIKPRNPGSIDNKTPREIKDNTIVTPTTTTTNTMLSPRKPVSIDNVNHNTIKELHANPSVKNNDEPVESKISNTPKLIDKNIKPKQKSKNHKERSYETKKILPYILLSNYCDVLDILNNDTEKTAEISQNDTDTHGSSFSYIPDATIEYGIKEKKK